MQEYKNIAEIIGDEIKQEESLVTVITSDAQADRIIGIIQSYREDMKTVKERAKETIDDYKFRVELWRDKQLETMDKQIEFYKGLLEDYYKAHSDGKKKMKFPSGNIGIYATRESYKWEDEKALAEYFVEQSKTNPVLYGFTLAYEPKLNKDKIKSMLTINENGIPEIEGREVPYLSYTAKGEAFNVR